ncbi:MAG: ATP-binding protein, partial [Gammaproteobacteria bacterium]
YVDKPIEVVTKENSRLVIESSDKVLSVMIGNILRNAFSYTDQGRIEIQIDADSISISDSGVGMSEQEVAQVFKPFYRTDAKPRGGHGVGLTIVKLLSERFHWHVKMESTPNVGTRVEITFPPHSVIHF